VRPENQSEVKNLAVSGTFGNYGGGNGQRFLNILLKSGVYGRVAGQDMRRNLFTRASTRDGDSHRPGCGSRDFRENIPSPFPRGKNNWQRFCASYPRRGKDRRAVKRAASIPNQTDGGTARFAIVPSLSFFICYRLFEPVKNLIAVPSDNFVRAEGSTRRCPPQPAPFPAGPLFF
jgi:hypothetical protein